jgi:hypothetical protein
MSDRRHPGPHPDADRLSAFIEGALTEQEREESLAHLSECEDCRTIVFLAQQAAPTPAREPAAVPAWRRWLPPLSFAAAAVACGLVVIVWMHPHPTPASRAVAIARQAAPLPTVSSAAPEPAPQRPAPPARARREYAAKNPVPAAPPAPAAPPSGAIGGLASGLATQSTQPAAQPAPPVVATDQLQPAPAAPAAAARLAPAPSAGSATAQQHAPGTFAAMRAATPLKQATPTSPPSVAGKLPARSAVSGFLAQPNPLHLTIEHNQGPDNGLSAISGAVTDPSGAIVPQASIVLESAAGATAATTTTDAQGRFTLPDVAPGQYEIRISAPGFQAEAERLDLQARDLARLSPVLQAGAVSETVNVSTENSALATTSATTGAQLADITPVLPSKLPATTTVAGNGRMLSLDARGALYLSRDAGQHWKKIRPVWTSPIAHLTVTQQAEPSALCKKQISGTEPPLFELTTTDGAIWISRDGAHWRLR